MNSKKNQSNAIAIIAANQPQSYAAYVATRAEREEVTEADAAAAAMNIDFGAAVSLALATQRRAMPLRDLIAKWVPGFEVRNLDKLEDYALSSQATHGIYITATTPTNSADLIARGMVARERFIAVVTVLSVFGLFPASRVDEIRSGASHRNVGEDLINLGTWLKTHFAEIENKSPVTAQEIAEGVIIGEEIMLLAGMRGDQAVSEAALDRRRAFVLLDRAYDELRRALTWLRWHEDDVDQIAPSLHAQPRSGRKPKTDTNADIVPAGESKDPVVPAPVVAPVLAPIEGTSDKPVPKNNPFNGG